MNDLHNLWRQITSAIAVFKPMDVLDILVVAYLVYHLIRLVRETRAMQLVKGMAGIFALYLISILAHMNTLSFFIQNIIGSGIVVLAIVFQPELRRALERMGRTKLGVFNRFGTSSLDDIRILQQEMIAAVCEACVALSADKVGALMVIEREIKLGEIIKTGTEIDARPSVEMIGNLFFHNAPLHDGALVIRDSRLFAAGCFLPLSANMEIGRELGTRHRAALGMSEVSDAVVVVVSEETGAISVAVDGRLQRKLSPQNLTKLLTAKLIPAEPEAKKGKPGRTHE